MLQEHIIQAPICAVVRKGKERFACDLRLQLRKTQVKQRGQGHDAEMRSLYNVSRNLDLDQAEGLSNFDRRLICVPEHCPKSCSARRSCRYRSAWGKSFSQQFTFGGGCFRAQGCMGDQSGEFPWQ